MLASHEVLSQRYCKSQTLSMIISSKSYLRSQFHKWESTESVRILFSSIHRKGLVDPFFIFYYSRGCKKPIL
jgi:hypothetical protein